MFTYELARQLTGTGVIVNAVDPGTYHGRFQGCGSGPVTNGMVYNTMQMCVTLRYTLAYHAK